MNINDIKNKLDIVDVVQKYVKLKRSGKYYLGLCPFHKETKPSFYVSEEMQIFKCFGCGASGDVIKFLMQIENLTFLQVLEKIKNEYGIEIELSKKNQSKNIEEKQIIEINYAALKFFRKEIKNNKDVLNYLLERGLKEKTIDTFEIGFSPGHTLLRDYLYAQNYDYSLIKKAGLLDSQNFDRFQSRIIFPLKDEKGRLVGFTGRIFPENLRAAKYLNTPETLIFKKSQFLYGLYYAKEHILSEKKAILVEGQFDFILSWQNNLKNVVAISGSALTADHLAKLKRYTLNLVFAFDNDDAGFKASLRANLIAQKLGFNTFKLIYQGKDLAEHFNSGGQLYEVKFIDYILDELIKKYQDKKDILDIFLPQIKQLSPLDIDNYLNLLSEKLKLSKEICKKELDNISEIYLPSLDKSSETNIVIEESSLEEKFSLKVVSLAYMSEEFKTESLLEYLSEQAKDLFMKILQNKLNEEEFTYFEMVKNFYLNNNLNLKKEFKKAMKNLKIIFFKKRLKNLNEQLKYATDVESDKIIEEIQTIVKLLKDVSKN
jgi:DNA primase